MFDLSQNTPYSFLTLVVSLKREPYPSVTQEPTIALAGYIERPPSLQQTDCWWDYARHGDIAIFLLGGGASRWRPTARFFR